MNFDYFLTRAESCAKARDQAMVLARMAKKLKGPLFDATVRMHVQSARELNRQVLRSMQRLKT